MVAPTKLLFAYDHRFTRAPDGLVYTAGPMPSSVWDRYLRHFDKVTVLSRIADGSAPSNAALSSHENVSFKQGPDLNSAARLLFHRSTDHRVIRDAVRNSDAVVARLPSEMGIAVVREARLQAKPLLVEVVGCAWDTYWNHGATQARLYAPLATWRMKRAVAQADFAIYVTEKWLQSRYPSDGLSTHASNVEVVPVPDRSVSAREARRAELVAGRMPVLGTVGSLHVRYKGIQTAIDAVARLRTTGLDLIYRVLGPGDPSEYRAQAERLGVDDLVHFDGTRKAGPDVAAWMDELDIYLQPSFQEGLPRATIEAMSRGLCCVGSTCGGIPELVGEERMHLPGDDKHLARILNRLVDNPQMVVEAGRAGSEKSLDYSREALQSRRDSVFAQLHLAALAQAEDRLSG